MTYLLAWETLTRAGSVVATNVDSGEELAFTSFPTALLALN